MYVPFRRITVQPVRSVLRWTFMSLVGIACGAPPTEPVSVRLTTERLEYAATDSVALLVTNLASRGEIGYGACPSYTVDERSGSSWRAVYTNSPAQFCTLILYTIGAGETDRLVVPLPATLAPSEYRIRVADFAGASTNSFRVR
jgi:hypothetical protein